jgi:Brp/Blh family beta-carotene 15,15'-monooxygenase
MNNLKKISVFTSFFGLWLTSYLSEENQEILGFTLIFTFGILHGANDLVLISQLKSGKKSKFIKILLSYVTIVLISVLLFTKIPIVALILFILVSSYHFGEQHWQVILRDGTILLIKLFQFNFGLLLLMLLFSFNKQAVIQIVNKITNIIVTEHEISVALLITIGVFLVNSILLMKTSTSFKKNAIEQLFYLLLLCIIFKVSGLIWGFTIYFIFWHSIPSLYDQIKFLYGNYSFSNFKKYFKSAFIYWIISLLGISVLFLISKDWVIFDALFFSFLAAITFPHAIVIVKMYEK